MAYYETRVNLSAAIFPFLSQLWGRSVIVPQYDMNFDRTLVSAADTDKDKGVPQAYYMHNTMPTPQGFQSISYTPVIAPLDGTDDFDAAFPIQNSDLARFIFSPSVGKNYIYDAVIGHWASVSPLPAGVVDANTMVTVAFVQGQSYIWYENYGGFTYNDTTKLMDPVSLSGLVATDIKGLCASNGYMIAWDDTSVVWSSITDPTDFVPSLATGAGGGALAEANGKIIVCLPISGGFIVYCEKNIVAARFTSNARFPFIFSQLPGSGGAYGPEVITWQSNLGDHFAWTTSGLQRISKDKAETLLPELSDFLSANVYEDFDETTRTFSVEFLSTPLALKLTAVADRYVVISYGKAGDASFTYAIVYDLVLKRWGKLKFAHRDCFQLNVPQFYGALTYEALGALTYGDLSDTTYGDLDSGINTNEQVRKTIAFLQADGTIKTVNFDLAQTTADGVLMLGKYQFMRQYRTIFLGADIENVQAGRTYTTLLFYTNDGKTFLPPKTIYEKPSAGLVRSYQGVVDTRNFSLLLLGAFNVVSAQIKYKQGAQT